MNASYLIQILAHGVLELLVSIAVIAWLAEDWKRNANARIARWLMGSRGIWLSISLAVAPPILAMLLGQAIILLFKSAPWNAFGMAFFFALSMFYGVLLAMAAVSCAPPVDAEGRNRFGPAVAICVALIFLPALLAWFGHFQPLFSVVQRVFLAAMIITVARLILGDREPPARTDPTAPAPALKSPARALLIGFAPSALSLIALPVADALHSSRSDSDSLLWMLCAVSIVCCFVASGMLFARRTGGAVLCGILFLLLNSFIAFFSGCCASFKM